MKAITTKLCNGELGQPRNWPGSNPPCTSLPVCRVADPILPLVFSWWKLSWKERVAVLLGKPIRLCIVGHTHAPVALEVDL